jgi:hypothetical protein
MGVGSLHELSACADALHRVWSGQWSCLNCFFHEVGAIGTSSFNFAPHSSISDSFGLMWRICILMLVGKKQNHVTMRSLFEADMRGEACHALRPRLDCPREFGVNPIHP